MFLRRFLLAAVFLAVVPAYAATVCGPGFDWMNNCRGGFDTFPSRAQHSIVIIGGPTIILNMTGPTVIMRGNPVGEPEVIQTELVSMNLTGGGLTMIAGDGIGNLLPDGPLFSGGQITELPGQLTADSFFDVFVQISGAPLGTMILHNSTPCHMQATIDRIPPIGTDYLCQNVPVILFNQFDQPVALLVNATHTPVPEPATYLLVGAGLVTAAWAARKRTRG